MAVGSAPGEKRLAPDLQRWLAAGLLSTEQAEAIVAFEQRSAPARKIPLFVEALGYIGAVLALAGGGVAIAQKWEDLSDPMHAGILASGAAIALLAGWFVRGGSEPAIQRMMSVLWALSVAGVTGTLGVVFVDIGGLTEDAVAVAIGGCTALYATALWWFHRRILQQFAVFASGLVTAIGIAIVLPGEVAGIALALISWAYGGVWLALGWHEAVEPHWGAIVMGAVVAAYGPTIDAGAHGWLLGVGLVTAGAFMWLSITERRLPLLGIGGIASFAYLTAIVVRYFGDALGIPVALALVGIVVLSLAVIFSRSGALDGGGWRHPKAHAT